jgi:uncharacterized membrane protein YbaN (DUF454 family)
MSAPRLHDSRAVRIVFLSAGVAALALGLLGVFLPILPTTPFVLLAAACFARGSQRLHDWLLEHAVAGPIVREWREHRSMPPGVKPWAFLLMGASFGFSIYVMESGWHRLMLAALGLLLAALLWRVPVRETDSA